MFSAKLESNWCWSSKHDRVTSRAYFQLASSRLENALSALRCGSNEYSLSHVRQSLQEVCQLCALVLPCRIVKMRSPLLQVLTINN